MSRTEGWFTRQARDFESTDVVLRQAMRAFRLVLGHGSTVRPVLVDSITTKSRVFASVARTMLCVTSEVAMRILNRELVGMIAFGIAGVGAAQNALAQSADPATPSSE